MKKMYLIGALMLMGVGAALISCDSIANGCKCTASVGGLEESYEYTKEEVKSAGVNSCSGLAAKIKQAAEAAGCKQDSEYNQQLKLFPRRFEGLFPQQHPPAQKQGRNGITEEQHGQYRHATIQQRLAKQRIQAV